MLDILILFVMQFRFVLESHVVECSNGELYAQRLLKLVYLHLSTDCFMKIIYFSSIYRTKLLNHFPSSIYINLVGVLKMVILIFLNLVGIKYSRVTNFCWQISLDH